MTPAQLDALIAFILTAIDAKMQADARSRPEVTRLEAKVIRAELLAAFDITEDQLEQAFAAGRGATTP